ncbi:FMN-dependent NADH-azoreductase [Salinisphaera sp. C84B14]|jgi:FMN-dependent NADH-azoreductase|uniref:FMN-dependent NADH-azoreductase n=1 Tax=Salinisphaera sp. C84B14 TaxID=1304155 RepID=UPI003341BF54
MTTILRIDASARQARSLSRMLGDRFIDRWQQAEPQAAIIRRDVGTQPPPAISEAWIAAAFTPADERSAQATATLALSNTLIDELEQADVLVITTPMYNYGMPAALKAWVDQVVRINRTFTFDLGRGDRPLEPILGGKQLVVLTSSGEFGFGAGQLNEQAGHLLPHLRSVAGYLGAKDIHHVGIEYQEFGDERFEKSKAEAKKQVAALAAALSTD